MEAGTPGDGNAKGGFIEYQRERGAGLSEGRNWSGREEARKEEEEEEKSMKKEKRVRRSRRHMD